MSHSKEKNIFADLRTAETIVNSVDRWANERSDENAGRWLNTKGKLVREMSFKELQLGAINVALYLRNECKLKKGDRVLLCFEPSLDFNITMLACFALGVIAVPVAPVIPRRFEQMIKKLDIVANDCSAVCFLCNTNYKRFIQLQKASSLLSFKKDKTIWATADWFAPRTDDYSAHEDYPTLASLSTISRKDLAFLQYTSGSTGNPKGVMVTFEQIKEQLELQLASMSNNKPIVSATFLPHYHDMGLIGTILQPWYYGGGGFSISPLSFLQRPVLYLEGISRYGSTHSAMPNFALHLLATRVKDEELVGIDLSSCVSLILGAEPIRPNVVNAFIKRFTPYGLDPGSLCPAYGLAEHVLAVTLRKVEQHTPPIFVKANRSALYQQHRFVPAENDDESCVELCESGALTPRVDLKIVDPQTGRTLPDNCIGEVWLTSPSLTSGYFGNEEATNKTFKAHLHEEDREDGQVKDYLRSGDLAFIRDGLLFITGRIKDVIIVNGANVYPQDIESVVEEAHPLVRKGCSVAFAVPAKNGLTDSYTIVAEVKVTDRHDERLTEIATSCAMAVNHVLGSFPEELVLVPRHGIIKTSSGKVARQPTKRAHQARQLDTYFTWDDRLLQFRPRPVGEPTDDQRPVARAHDDMGPNRRRSALDLESSSSSSRTPPPGALKRTFSAHDVSEERSSAVRNLREERYHEHEPASDVNKQSLRTLQSQLARVLCRHIDGDLRPSDIDIHTHYSVYGLTSVASMQVLGEINDVFDANLEPHDLFQYPTIAELSLLLQPSADEMTTVADMQQELYDEISETTNLDSAVISEESDPESSEHSNPEAEDIVADMPSSPQRIQRRGRPTTRVNRDDGLPMPVSRPTSRAGSRTSSRPTSRSNSRERKGSLANLRKRQQKRIMTKRLESAVAPNIGKYEMPVMSSLIQFGLSCLVILICFLPAAVLFQTVSAWAVDIGLLWIPVLAACAWFFYGIILSTILIIVKRYVLSDVKPGRYTVGKPFYLRCWFVHRLWSALRTLFLDAFVGTPIPWLVLRALGAKLDWNVQISSLEIPDPWLLTVGEGSTISGMCRLNTSHVFGGGFSLHKIEIGKNCHLGFHSCVDLGCYFEDGSKLEPYSWAHPFSRLKKGATYQGSPAEQIFTVKPNNSPTLPPPMPIVGAFVRVVGALACYMIPAFAAIIGYGIGFQCFSFIFPVDATWADNTAAAASFSMLLSWNPAFLPIFMAMIPGLTYETFQSFYALASSSILNFIVVMTCISIGLTAFMLIYCGLTFGFRKLILAKAKDTYRANSKSDHLRFIAKFAMDLSYSNYFWMAHATFLYNWWLRLNGAKIGNQSIVGYVSVSEPENLEIGSKSFIGGRVQFVTTTEEDDKKDQPVHRVNKIKIGDSSLLGLYSTCTSEGVESNVVIGATATCPKKQDQDAGAVYFGNPTIKIIPPKVEEPIATEPSISRFFKQRFGTVLLMMLLLPSVFMAPLPAQLLLLWLAGPNASLFTLIFAIPIAVLGVIMSLVFSYNLWKKALIGRLHKTRPIPVSNTFLARTQLFGRILFFLHRYMDFFRGSEGACQLYRLLGADIGENVYIENTGCMTEPDLITIGDHSVIGPGCFLWSHFFINRCNTWDEIIIGKEVQLGPLCLVSAGVTIGDSAVLSPCSTLMASTKVGKNKGLCGSPAHVNNEALLRYGLSIIAGTSMY